MHQYLSPNDNRLHGTAKRSWRTSHIDFTDDIRSTILLLHLLDHHLVQYGLTWFQRNMSKLKEADVSALIGGKPKRSNLSAERLEAYYLAVGAQLTEEKDDSEE